MSYEIKICDILKGAAMEGQYKGAQRGAKCEEIANELTRRGTLIHVWLSLSGWKTQIGRAHV